MRVYGRVLVPYPPSGVVDSETVVPGTYKWVVVETDANGNNDYVYITALIQCLRLNLGESPFFATFGLPAEVIVLMQLQPDYYVNYIQAYFAQFFASLVISKQPQVVTNEAFQKGAQAWTTPVYNVSIIRKNGSLYQTTVAL